LDPNGRIVAVGSAWAPYSPNYALLARYTKNGLLDTSFGTQGGTLVVPFEGPAAGATDVALQVDGKIVVAGLAHYDFYDPEPTRIDFAVARYETDGSLDAGFGEGGVATIDFALLDDLAAAVAIQPDNKIVLAGGTYAAPDPYICKFALARVLGGPLSIPVDPGRVAEDLQQIVDVLDSSPCETLPPVVLAIDTSPKLASVIEAVNAIRHEERRILVGLCIAAGYYDGGQVVAVPEGIDLTIIGAEGAAIVAADEPALTIASGEVELTGQLTLETTGPTPTLNVLGGTLRCREMKGYIITNEAPAEGAGEQIAVQVSGSTVEIDNSVIEINCVAALMKGKHVFLNVSGGTLLITDSSIGMSVEAAPAAAEVVAIKVEEGDVWARDTRFAFTATPPGFRPMHLGVVGCTVDLGTADDPGGNTFVLVADGEFISNLGPDPIWAVGNTFILNGQDISGEPYLIEDHIYHALDEAGCGLVTYVPGTVYVTPASGSIQRGVDAVPEGGTVNVEAGMLQTYDAGTKLLTVAFQDGPTLTLEPDPQKPGSTRLVVTGTPEAERILFEPGGRCGDITVVYSGARLGTHRPTSRLVAEGEGGDDVIAVGCLIGLSARLYGGEGNDALVGGSGNDVLLGGEGNDALVGGLGRNLLVGGNGSDLLIGGFGEDILIAGRTIFDEYSAANDAALYGIMLKWTSSSEYLIRVAGLRGILTAGSDTLEATVFDDNARDVLFGLLGRDWLFANVSGDGIWDWIADRSPNEIVEDLLST